MGQTQLFQEEAVDDELPLKLELIKQIGWLVRLRWIAIAGVFFTVTVANLAGNMISHPIPLYVIAVLMVLYNFAVLMVLYNFKPRMYRKAPEQQRLMSIKRQACIHIILDLLSLIALIHFSGGVENPFIFYFIFHLIIASIILSKRVSYILATLNTLLLSSLISLEYFRILPHYHLNNFLPEELWHDPIYTFGVLFVFTSTLFFSVYLATTITQTARERETETRELKENLEEKVDELVETRKEVVFERNKLKSIIECMHEGVVFVDSTNQTTLFNKAAQQIQQEQSDLEINTDLQFGSAQTLDQISQDFADGGDAIERKDQQIGEKHLENTYAAVRDDEDNYLGTVLVSRDVTDRKRMEQQLIFSEKMAAIGELAAGVAHEINNPLDGLLNCILRIKRNPKNVSQTQEYLDLMEEAIRRIEATIGKLLDFSRPHELTLTAINLNDVVHETIGLIDYGASEKGIQIEKDFQDKIALIHGDEHLLEQVILNLTLNAITAMPDGGTLRFETGEIILDALLAQPSVYIKVIDTGIGISKSVQDRIFDPFYTTQITQKGTGLGLSVSDRIVRQHQGVIEVESEEGNGSTFTVKLPIAQKQT